MREDDATLLRRYADDRAQDAFAELVRRNTDAVYSAALRRVSGDAHLAQDVTQEVFVTLAQRADELARHPILSAWLHTATRNAAINRIRGESRRRLREEEAQAMHDIFSNRERDADWSEVAPVLDEAIDQLGERDRAAVFLRFFDLRTFAEIGAALRLSEDAARMRVERAIDKLRGALARRGVRSTAAALGAVLAQNTVSAAPAGVAASVAKPAMHAAALAAAKAQAAAAGSGAGTGFLAGLSAAPVVAGLALAVILVAVGVGLQVRRSTRVTEAAVAAGKNEVAKMEERLSGLQRTLQMQERELARLRAVLAAPPPAAAPRPANTGGVGAPALTAETPGARRRLAGGRRAEVASMYDALYRSLQLTPAQIRQFEAVSVRGAGDGLWVFDKDAAESDAAAAAPPLSADAVDAEVRAVLGEAAYAEYKNYNRILPARGLAAKLASALYLSDPISQHQGERFAAIVANASPAYRAGGAIEPAGIEWDAVTAAARAVLSPGQLDALARVREQAVLDQAMVRQIARWEKPTETGTSTTAAAAATR